MSSAMTDEKYWQKGIQRTRSRINLAWFLTVVARPLGVSLLLLAGVIFYLRWESISPETILSLAVAALLGGTLLIGWLGARGKWEKTAETITRLDDELSLHNQLSMATGLGYAYPAQQPLPPIFKWRMQYFMPPILIGLAAVALAVFFPFTRTESGKGEMQEPLAWSELEEDLQNLKEEELVQEEYLEEKEKELNELRSQDPQEWYDHSSLEATDHLLNQHSEQRENLSSNLKEAAEQLQAMESGKGNPGALKAAYNEFQEALESMENSQMKPNKDLLNQMKELSPEGLKQLSAEEVEQLKKRMEGMSEQLKNGEDGKDGKSGEDGLKDGKRQGEAGEGDCENGDCPSGSPSTGGGDKHDEILYGDTHERLEAGLEGGLEAQDLSDFTPGDLLELQDAAPEANTELQGIRHSGSTANLGEGGKRVWKQALLPAEQQALKSFFNNDDK